MHSFHCMVSGRIKTGLCFLLELVLRGSIEMGFQHFFFYPGVSGIYIYKYTTHFTYPIGKHICKSVRIQKLEKRKNILQSIKVRPIVYYFKKSLLISVLIETSSSNSLFEKNQ